MHTRLRLWPSHTSTRTRARMPRPSRPPPQNAGALSRTEPTSLTSVAGVDSSSAVGTALPPSRTPNQSEAPTRGTHEEDSNAIVMHQGHRRGPPPDYSSARKSHQRLAHFSVRLPWGRCVFQTQLMPCPRVVLSSMGYTCLGAPRLFQLPCFAHGDGWMRRTPVAGRPPQQMVLFVIGTYGYVKSFGRVADRDCESLHFCASAALLVALHEQHDGSAEPPCGT